MKKTILAFALAIAPLWLAPANAAPFNCQVYATQPVNAFTANSNPIVPCDKNGSVWVNAAAAAGGTSSNYNSAFPAAGTAAGYLDDTNGNMVPGTISNSDKGLYVHVTNGAAGGTSSAYGAAFPSNGTAAGLSDGTNMVAARVANGIGDNTNGALLLATAGFVWDGTNFDRMLQPLTSSQLSSAGLATAALQTTGNTALGSINTTLGSPMQNSGGSVTANLGTIAGAATAALQTTGNTALGTINTTLGSPMQNSGGSVTANLGTIAGAATAALQTTGNTALGTINTTLGSPMQNSGGTVTAVQPTGTNLHIVCDSGCSGSGGTSSAYGAAFPANGTAVGMSDGTNMVPFKSTNGTAVDVNCTVGCAGGSFNNNADNVATSSANGQAASWPYVWDGSAWDRLYGDSTNGAFVNVKTSVLPTGAATATGLSTINTTLGSPMQNSGGSVTANLGTIAGAATAALQTTGNTALGTINTTLGSPMQNSGGSVTANLGTIAGVATAANQATEISSLSTIATNTGVGQGSTGSTVPAGAIYGGVNVGGNLTGAIGCGSTAIYDASTSGSTQLVALASSQVIYICGYTILAGGTVNVKFVYGTGSNCVTSPQNMTPAFQLTAQTGAVDGSATFRGLKTAASNALCINASGATAVQAIVYYTQF